MLTTKAQRTTNPEFGDDGLPAQFSEEPSRIDQAPQSPENFMALAPS